MGTWTIDVEVSDERRTEEVIDRVKRIERRGKDWRARIIAGGSIALGKK